jgi:hypothetical protein
MDAGFPEIVLGGRIPANAALRVSHGLMRASERIDSEKVSPRVF